MLLEMHICLPNEPGLVKQSGGQLYHPLLGLLRFQEGGALAEMDFPPCSQTLGVLCSALCVEQLQCRIARRVYGLFCGTRDGVS